MKGINQFACWIKEQSRSVINTCPENIIFIHSQAVDRHTAGPVIDDRKSLIRNLRQAGGGSYVNISRGILCKGADRQKILPVLIFAMDKLLVFVKIDAPVIGADPQTAFTVLEKCPDAGRGNGIFRGIIAEGSPVIADKPSIASDPYITVPCLQYRIGLSCRKAVSFVIFIYDPVLQAGAFLCMYTIRISQNQSQKK